MKNWACLSDSIGAIPELRWNCENKCFRLFDKTLHWSSLVARCFRAVVLAKAKRTRSSTD